jgi:Phage endonuclease I
LITKKAPALIQGYRSGLEEAVAAQLQAAGVNAGYETHKIKYTAPASSHTYTPDFILPNSIVVETKGRLVTADRKKHLLIKTQHPDLDIRFVFSNSRAKISKTSATTYGAWCEKAGIKYTDKRIPTEWLREKPNDARVQALSSVLEGW